MNFASPFFIRIGVGEEGEVSVSIKTKSQALLAIAMEHNIKIIPMAGHTDQWHIGKHFPETQAVKKDAAKTDLNELNIHTRPLCFSNPKTLEVMESIFIETARLGVDGLAVSMAEGEGQRVCYCEKCGGDDRKQFSGEIDCIVNAFEKAKQVNPSFELLVSVSQGTYKHNEMIFERIPQDKNIVIKFYHGGLTYNTKRAPIIPESISALCQKRPILIVPLFAGSWSDNEPLYPFTAAAFVKERMLEMVEKGTEGFIGWIPPSIFALDFNAEAVAEYAWNAKGRSPRDFAVSWAVRKGYTDEDAQKIADVCGLLEEPERSFYIATANWTARHLFNNTVNAWKGKGGPLRGGFEHGDDFTKYLEMCSRAETLALQLDDLRFLHEARLVKSWIGLLKKCWAFHCEKKGADAGKLKMLADNIKKELDLLPLVWRQWIAVRASESDNLYWERYKSWELSDDKASRRETGLMQRLSNFKAQMDACLSDKNSLFLRK